MADDRGFVVEGGQECWTVGRVTSRQRLDGGRAHLGRRIVEQRVGQAVASRRHGHRQRGPDRRVGIRHHVPKVDVGDAGRTGGQRPDGGRTDTGVIVMHGDDEGVAGAGRSRGRQQCSGHLANARLRRPDRLQERIAHRRVAHERADPRATLEDLLGCPGAECLEQAAGIAAPDAERDGRRHERGPDTDREQLLWREDPTHGQQQHARQDGPDLAWHAIDEGQHLCPPIRGHGVEERAPGRVRHAALGHLLGESDERCRCERELHHPQPEADQVHDGQQDGPDRYPEPGVQAVGDGDRHDERCRGHRGRQQAQGGRHLDIRGERARRRHQERVEHRERQDREQDIGDRDERHQRRPPDMIEPRPQLLDDGPRRAASTARVEPTWQPGDEDRGDDEQARLDDDEGLDSGQSRQRSGPQGADEEARDRRSGQQREQALGLAGVERRPSDRPVQRHRQRAGGIDRQPQGSHDRPIAAHQRDAEGDHDRRDGHQDADEQRHSRQSPERDAVGQGDDQPGDTQGDEQEGQDLRQRLGTEAAQDQRIDADLAEAAGRLEYPDDQRHPCDERAFAGPDAQGPHERCAP